MIWSAELEGLAWSSRLVLRVVGRGSDIASTGGGRAWLVVVPAEVGVVAEFPEQRVSSIGEPYVMEDVPRLDEMCGGEERAQDDAESADDDVGNAEERVAAAHDGPRGDDERLGAAIDGHGEVCAC